MEIWPVGHYSPIHSHANANAIIRVLNGEITVKLFPFLCAEKDGVAPFSVATFKKGDITWITPSLNQTHQLTNLETNPYTCITIQCYMYNASASGHYDYFDYLDDTGAKQPYEPDSDMDFVEFKAKMREEWASRTAVPTVGSQRKCGWWC
jgi:predicted metal-dependent enzyme (double-stranded beta helix superfamily)